MKKLRPREANLSIINQVFEETNVHPTASLRRGLVAFLPTLKRTSDRRTKSVLKSVVKAVNSARSHGDR